MSGRARLLAPALLIAFFLAGPALDPLLAQTRTVRGRMQPKPGAPVQDVEVAVHEAPAEVQLGSPAEAKLDDQDLVLGVVVGGQAVAYPIRFLAEWEVVNSRVGDASLAPTW